MKILGCDYDGTLYLDEKVSIEDRKAIKTFRNNGGIFGIVTGRCLSMILGELNNLQICFDFLILCNSGFILDKHLNTIDKKDIDYQTGLDLIGFLQEEEARFGVTDGNRFYRYAHPKVAEQHRRPFINEIKVSLEDIIDNKIFTSFFYRHQDVEKTLKGIEKIKERYQESLSYHYNGGTLDINGAEVSKEAAISKISKHFNTTNIYTIGDNYNDINMINRYYGFAMEQGVTEAKANAKHVVKSVAEAISIINGLK